MSSDDNKVVVLSRNWLNYSIVAFSFQTCVGVQFSRCDCARGGLSGSHETTLQHGCKRLTKITSLESIVQTTYIADSKFPTCERFKGISGSNKIADVGDVRYLTPLPQLDRVRIRKSTRLLVEFVHCFSHICPEAMVPFLNLEFLERTLLFQKYDLQSIAKASNMSGPYFVFGPGCGPYQDIGCNCEVCFSH